jgi:pimeloyl-ACP methyl ester carboxylesterase
MSHTFVAIAATFSAPQCRRSASPGWWRADVTALNQRRVRSGACQSFGDVRSSRHAPGDADGAPHQDSRVYAKKFSGPYAHRLVTGVGHNLPQEAPRAFAEAVMDVDRW